MAKNLTPKQYIDSSNIKQILTAIKNEIPTTVAELTDSSSYAKTADIPTTLPANGGNADTVNNHTVNSDVPENAKFTDTVYDDTEVKGSITEIRNDLGSTDISAIGDGTVTGAIDAISNRVKSVEDDNVYSTDEQIAGIYLDGKTIYRRSLEIPLDGEPKKTYAFIDQGVTALEGVENISIYVNQIAPTVDLSAWNIDTMVKVYGHVIDYTDSTKTERNVSLPYPVTYGTKPYVTGWYSYGGKKYIIRAGEQYANKSTAFLTFEYTKI